MAINAGAVYVTLDLDTKAFETKLNQAKASVGTLFNELRVRMSGASNQAAIMGNVMQQSFVKGNVSNQAFIAGLQKAQMQMNAVATAAKRVNGVVGNIRVVTPNITHMNNSFSNTRNILSTVHGRITLLTGALVALLGKGVAVGAQFENEMQRVGAVAGASGEQLESMTMKARELGRTTTFMASEVAKAMTILAQAGFKPTQIEESIGAILDVARAGSVSLETAASVVLSVSNTFGVAAKDMSTVGDLLVATANNSATSIEMLGESFKYAGATAAQTGQTMQETAAIIGVLANRGLKGTVAGTAFNEAMRRLASTDTQDKLAKLGIAVEKTNGQMRSGTEIMRDMKNATSDLSAVKQSAFFLEILGVRGSRMGQLVANAADDVDKMKNTLSNVNGVAAQTRVAMERDLLSQFRILISAVDELAIAFKDSLYPQLIKGVAYFKELATGASDLLKEYKDLGPTIGTIAALMASFAAMAVSIKFVIIPLALAVKGLVLGLVEAGGVILKVIGFVSNLHIHLAALPAVVAQTIAAIKGMIASLTIASGIYGVLALAIGVSVYEIMKLVGAQSEAADSADDLRKKLKALSETDMTFEHMEKVVQGQVDQMVKEGKSIDQAIEELKSRAASARNQIDNNLHFISRPDASPMEVVAASERISELRRYIHTAEKLIEKGVKISDAAMREQTEKELEQYNLREAQYQKALDSMLDAEKKFLDDVDRLKEAKAKREDQKRFSKVLQGTRGDRAVELSDVYMEETKIRRDLNDLNQKAQELKGTLRETFDFDTQRVIDLRNELAKLNNQPVQDEATKSTRAQLVKEMERLKEINEQGGTGAIKILEIRKKIVSLTERENELAERKGQIQEANAKAELEARKKYKENEERMENTQSKIRDLMESFTDRNTGVKSSVQVTRGGSLSERLGAADPAVSLNQKSLKELEKQTGKLEGANKILSGIREDLKLEIAKYH